MAKANKPAQEQTTVHPDIVLIQDYQAAQQAVKAYQDRLTAVVGALMAQTSQPAPEALEDAKRRINAFLEKEYPNKSARRGVATDIDLDGYKFETPDIGDIAPELFELAQQELEGKILVDGTEALYRSIVDYVCSARDEDGSPVLLAYQQQAVKNLFFPPAPTVQRAQRAAKPRTEGAAPNGQQSVNMKICKWPGTDISAKVTEFANGAIRVQGRGKSNLIASLAAIGITVTNDAVDKTMTEVYKAG